MSKVQVVQKPYLFLKQGTQRRFNFLFGGASSSKSWSIAQYLIVEKFLTEPAVGILALRRTKPEVRVSCYRLIKNILEQIGVEYEDNKTEMILYNPNNKSHIYCDGVDDVLKKKSIEGINYIWVEEATEFTRKEWMQLNIRCRAKNLNGINRIFASFNPEDPVGNAWLKALVEEAESRDDSQVLHLTFLDNPFLSNDERQQIENLADEDDEYNKIYRLGQWATPTHIIYTNWDIVEEFPPNDYLDDIGYGLDFGYNNPTALIKIGIRDIKDLYIQEVIYESKLTNPQLIELMKLMGISKTSLIMADSAEPARIEEIHKAGFNIRGVVKGTAEGSKGWVALGIDKVKRYKIHVSKTSVNAIEEFRGYKWKCDKNGNILDEPLKFKDHALDAMRYYLSSSIKARPTLEFVGAKEQKLTLEQETDIWQSGDDYDEE